MRVRSVDRISILETWFLWPHRTGGMWETYNLPPAPRPDSHRQAMQQRIHTRAYPPAFGVRIHSQRVAAYVVPVARCMQTFVHPFFGIVSKKWGPGIQNRHEISPAHRSRGDILPVPTSPKPTHEPRFLPLVDTIKNCSRALSSTSTSTSI